MQCLGSNIYNIIQTSTLYLYDQYQDLGKHNDGELKLIEQLQCYIHPTKIENLKFLAIPTTDQLEPNKLEQLQFEVVRSAFERLQYPFYQSNVIFNPYDTSTCKHNEINAFEIQTTQIQGRISLVINPIKYRVSYKTCLQDIRRDISKHMHLTAIKNKYKNSIIQSTLFIPNKSGQKMIVENILFHEYDTLVPHFKYQNLSDFFKTKHKMLATQKDIIIKTNMTGKYQYIYPEFCNFVTTKQIYKDSSSYGLQLLQWNRLINQNKDFLLHLKKYNLILANKQQTFKIRYLEPGHLVFSNNVVKDLQQLILSRTTEEFEHFYKFTFLDQNTIFTTNLTLEQWCIITNSQQDFQFNEAFNKFLNSIKSITALKSYKIKQPIILQVKQEDDFENIKSQISVTNQLVMICGTQEFLQAIQQEAQFYLSTLGIPSLILKVPQEDNQLLQYSNRVLSQITGQIGSSAWSLKEINGQFLQFKVVSLIGLSFTKLNDQYIVTMTHSFNKFLTKYSTSYNISTNLNESIQKCFKEIMIVFYTAQKAFPDLTCILLEHSIIEVDALSDIINESFENLRTLLNIEGQNVQKPTMYLLSFRNQQIVRCFIQPDEDFNPHTTQNPTMGTCVQISENNYLVAFQKQHQGSPYMTEVEIGQCQQEEKQTPKDQIILQCFRLLFVNCNLNFNTYLPAPIEYSKALQIILSQWLQDQRNMENLQVFKKQLLSGKLLYI